LEIRKYRLAIRQVANLDLIERSGSQTSLYDGFLGGEKAGK